MVRSNTIENMANLSVDVWVVGAGLVGSSIAKYLADSGLSVGVIESSKEGDRNKASELNRGFTTGDEHTDPYETRKRGRLGTAGLWNIDTPFFDMGGRFVFPDSADLDGSIPGTKEWGVSLEDLQPFAEIAQENLGIKELRIQEEVGEDVVSGSYSMQSYRILAEKNKQFFSERENVHFFSGVTVLQVKLNESKEKVVGLKCNDSDGSGSPFNLIAENFVIATGVIENARILMVSGAIGNHSGHLGKHYLDHTIDNSIYLEVPRDMDVDWLSRFDTKQSDGYTYLGYERPHPDYRREHQLINYGYVLSPSPWWIHCQEVGHLKKLLKGDLNKLRLKNLVKGSLAIGCLMKHRYKPYRLFGSKNYGWSRASHWQKYRKFVVAIVAEQRESSEHYLELSDEVDSLGIQKIKVNWKWTKEDAERLNQVKIHIMERFKKSGFHVRLYPSSLPQSGSHHHFGSTRMSKDSRDGVVGIDGCVFGVSNLYLGGASLCSSSSFVNPTYIGMTMGLYVADKLVKKLQNEG